MSPDELTIGEYLIQQLYSHGVRHIFGIPGDYVLGFYKQLEESKIKVINTCDEQGAGFAADAYARIKGLGAVCVTVAMHLGTFSAPFRQLISHSSTLVATAHPSPG